MAKTKSDTIRIKKPAKYTAAKKAVKKTAKKKAVKKEQATPIDFKAKFEKSQADLRFVKNQIGRILNYVPKNEKPDMEAQNEKIAGLQRATSPGNCVPYPAPQLLRTVTDNERIEALGQIEGGLKSVNDFISEALPNDHYASFFGRMIRMTP